jgi:hypothetical protein
MYKSKDSMYKSKDMRMIFEGNKNARLYVKVDEESDQVQVTNGHYLLTLKRQAIDVKWTGFLLPGTAYVDNCPDFNQIWEPGKAEHDLTPTDIVKISWHSNDTPPLRILENGESKYGINDKYLDLLKNIYGAGITFKGEAPDKRVYVYSEDTTKPVAVVMPTKLDQ